MNAPPRVKGRTIEQWWGEQPPEPGARCVWWQQRIEAGWRPNKRIRALGYYSSALYFGVYIWEWINVLSPMLYDDIRVN